MTPRRQSSPTSPEAQDQAFLQVLAHHTMLRAYVLAIVRDPHLAEDVLSDATLEIVHAWGKFDTRLAFAPWARGVARRVALATLRKNRRTIVELDEDVLDSLGLEFDRLERESELEVRQQQLRACLDKLPELSRDLVRRRYFDEEAYQDIAQRTGRTMAALYKAFSRIHETLARCVKSSLQTA